jgi:hypothetical protein
MYRACTERGSIVLTKDPKPRIIAQASPSIYISVPASEPCPNMLKTIAIQISTETDKSKPDSISDHQPLNIDTKGHITAKPSSISFVLGGFPNNNTLSNNHLLNSNQLIIQQSTRESWLPKRYANESAQLVEATPTVEQALSGPTISSMALCNVS